MSAGDLYDRDFFQWTQRNAALLRAGRLDEADLDHIAEEIEDMGKSQRRALYSRLTVLLAHLLKWQFQPELRATSTWKHTIRTQRRDLARLLQDAPSLQPVLVQILAEVYSDAADDAADETGLPPSSLPPTCPYSLDQILDRSFFPN